MKKVLFVIPGLGHGGTNRSLKNLLGRLGETNMQVEILALHGEGVYYDDFRKYLQKSVQPLTEALGTFDKRGKNEPLLSYLKRFYWKLIYIGVYRSSNKKIYAAVGKRLKKMQYDVVVAFQEAMATELAAYISAPEHIAWVRCDYKNYMMRKATYEDQEDIYARFNKIICVSDYTGQVFKDIYPNLKDRVLSIHNIIDDEAIGAAAREPIVDERFSKAEITFISIGRFTPEKRFSEIPAMAAYLKANKIPFKWYIIGDGGTEKPAIINCIKENNVMDSIILLGEKKNPYPYIAQSDILVCPSYTEACPNVVNEAKILHVPVVAADFASAPEFVQHGANGLIVPIEEMAETLLRLYRDKMLLANIRDGIADFVYDNAEIEAKIRNLITGASE